MDSRVLRVVQLDAARLDSLLVDMLQKQVLGLFAPLQSTVLETHVAEVKAALSAILYTGIVMPSNATYGQKLLGLQYVCHSKTSPSRYRFAAHFVCTIVIPLLWSKLLDAVVRLRSTDGVQDSVERIVAAVHRVDVALVVAKYINHILFLLHGRYLSLADRMCGMRTSSIATVPRRISYDFLTRELLWHGFSEFAVFILPYIHLRRVQGALRRWWRKGRGRTSTTPSMGESSPNYTRGAKCGICAVDSPWTPYSAQCCGAVFCYHCIQTNCTMDSAYECPKCFEVLATDRLVRCTAVSSEVLKGEVHQRSMESKMTAENSQRELG
eukprot:m.646709 g.646709  ORF g.646709 m.646709 type:complete len:325 (+) comp22651_c0_seq82:188-1162(+)